MKIPFLNRSDADSANVPAEIQEYYQSEKRERVGVAWLLAAGTLVLTLFLAFGLFFGGRWAYRKIANRGNTDTTQTQPAESTEQSPVSGTDTQSPSSSTGTSSATTSTPSPSTTSVAPATTSQPAALPNTGPDGDF